MIVVTGAGGRLEWSVIEGLLRRVPAGRIVANLRDPAKATFSDGRAQVRAGDFAGPSSLAAALAGAEQVLVASVNQLGKTARRLHRAA